MLLSERVCTADERVCLARHRRNCSGGPTELLAGSFPGLREAQRLAVRDEVRHIGVGVSYAPRRVTRDGGRVRALIEEIVDGFQALGDSLLEDTAPGVLDDFAGAYGTEPATLWAEVLHQLRLRPRSIGFGHAGRDSRSRVIHS